MVAVTAPLADHDERFRYRRPMTHRTRPIGEYLREWRQRRRLSQLDLACAADISARHLSFLETGRAQPSREMVLHLAEELLVPVRERNVLLIAAGFAPIFPERRLDDPALEAIRQAVDMALDAHRPFPAFAIDRHWQIVASNGALPQLYSEVSADLLKAPINALRISLHPEGLARRIVNLGAWRAHLLLRLRRQIDLTGDPALIDLQRELNSYPATNEHSQPVDEVAIHDVVAVPFRFASVVGPLSFYSTTTVFGTPIDVTLSELALEFFYPADRATADRVRSLG
jgi:transcriptional regulator with XRE-family HTH domain